MGSSAGRSQPASQCIRKIYKYSIIIINFLPLAGLSTESPPIAIQFLRFETIYEAIKVEVPRMAWIERRSRVFSVAEMVSISAAPSANT